MSYPIELRDEDMMPFGAHNDKTMEEVPASYLLYMKGVLEQSKEKGKLSQDGIRVLRYIKENLDVLDKQAQEDNRKGWQKRSNP